MISSRQPELVSGSHYELFNSLMRFRNTEINSAQVNSE